MIECTSEYIYRRKKRKRKKGIISFLIVIILIFCSTFYFKNIVYDQVANVCESKCFAICSNSVNSAVSLSLVDGVDYNNLVGIEKDSNGNITLLNINPERINKIARKIVNFSYGIMSDIIEKGVQIPMFSFTGIKILSGYGPNVTFKSVRVGNVQTEFVSKFESVGINQTLHSILVEVTCKISIIFPFDKREVSSTTTVLISEAVLVGKVPEVYLNGGFFGK